MVPWQRLEAPIEPHYPTAGNGRKPDPLSTMLRRFAGLDAGVSRLADETTILNFRHLLEAHQLAGGLFQEVVSLLTDRDPEMTSSKKGNQWPFGTKAHIGVDPAHALVHTLAVTTGKVSDDSMAEVLLHGDEATALGDRGYADKTREPDREREEDDIGPRWFVPFKRKKGCDTTPEQKRLNRILPGLRSAVEHPFRVLKRPFGYTKMRYRGLFGNEQDLLIHFALVNLYLARHTMEPTG